MTGPCPCCQSPISFPRIANGELTECELCNGTGEVELLAPRETPPPLPEKTETWRDRPPML